MSDPPGIRSSTSTATIFSTDDGTSPSLRDPPRSRDSPSLPDSDPTETSPSSPHPTRTPTPIASSMEMFPSKSSLISNIVLTPTTTTKQLQNDTDVTYSNTNPNLSSSSITHHVPDKPNIDNQENEYSNVAVVVSSSSGSNSSHPNYSTMRLPNNGLSSPSSISTNTVNLTKANTPLIHSTSTTTTTVPTSPLMNTINHLLTSPTPTQATSPRMQLPLPPGGTLTPLSDNHNNIRTSSSSHSLNRKGTPLAAIAASSSGSTTTTPHQKALKFSSLKKRKQQHGGHGSNALLNRLFCSNNASYVLSSNNSLIEEEEIKTNSSIQNNMEEAQSTPTNDGTSKSRSCTTNNVDVSACVKIGTTMLEQASESLTLHDEDKVRADIQSNIQDTLDIVCSPNLGTSSPPTYCSTSKVSAFLQSSNILGTKNSPLRSTHKSPNPTSNVHIHHIATVSDEQPSDESIEISSDGNIEQPKTSGSWSKRNEDEKSEMISLTKSQSSDDPNNSVHKTPMRRNQSNKPMKTPGGLVIPSPFTHHSGKGLFPSTFGNAVAVPSTSNHTSKSSTTTTAAASTGAAAITKMSPLASAKKIASSRKEAKQQSQGHPIPIVYIPDMTTTSSSTSTTMATSTGTTSDPLLLSPTQSSTTQHRSPDRIETQRRASPILVRITSSLEDLETVPEVTTSKEIDDTTTTSGGETDSDHNNNINNKRNGNEQPTKNEEHFIDETEFLPNRSTASFDKTTSHGGTSTTGIEVPQRLSKSPVPGEHVLHRMNFTSIDELKMQYERKLSEQKDQVALSNRVAKMRLDEIERLEAIMDTLKDRQSNTDEIQRLKDRLQQLQQEKKKDIERARKEIQFQLEQQNQDWLQKQIKYRSMEDELIQVKKQLAEAETSARPMITLAPSNDVNEEVERLKAALADANMALVQKENDAMMIMNDEVVTLKKQLTLCKEELANAIASSEQSNQSVEVQISTETERLQLQDELANAKEELSKVTSRLVQKEKELASTKKAAHGETSLRTSTMSTPNRYTSPRTTPVRSGSKIRSRASLSNDNSKSAVKQREDIHEMNEREKETLRNQISLLNAHVTEMSQEHDRALMELRKANETEITRIKTELESRLEHHKIMEQELKESLSAASSNERDELLEQIEILQAEKKLDQLSGLRDVQKREELLHRITTLEQKDKALAESHERAVEELRIKSEMEIQQLRIELQSKEDLRLEREKAIESSLAESFSFEKNNLAQKIEKLEGQLDSERSGAVLLRIKISNIEKEMEDIKQQHRQELETQKASTANEIQRLQMELKERLALEEAMQITTNERDAFEEELQLLKVKYDQHTRKSAEKMEELKKMHSHEKTVVTNELLNKITKLENELNENNRDIDQASRKKCEELKVRYDEQVDTLTKNHADEIANLRLEMHSIEEKYKVLVTESNSQFESFQKDAESKIEGLKETLRSNEKKYANDLKLAEQRAVTDDTKLLEHSEELKKLKAEHEIQLKAAEASHNKHFEDLLAQLDLVEAEQLQTTAAKDKALSEKDAIVDALGSQLAEAQRKITEAQSNRNIDLNTLEESRKAYQALEKLTQTLRNEVRDLKEVQKKFLKEAEIKKEKACEEAREEMIEKAEVQFQQANEHYVKLRKQYDESQERVKKFENELKLLRKKVEKLTKEKESAEIDLKAELAQMHAANAKIEAESAQKAKEYRREMERLLQTAKTFEAKAEEATSTSRSIQTTLATVVAEKQKLQQEYEEMKSVSEELMAIVEGGERHDC